MTQKAPAVPGPFVNLSSRASLLRAARREPNQTPENIPAFLKG
jgi:hypothetical protein